MSFSSRFLTLIFTLFKRLFRLLICCRFWPQKSPLKKPFSYGKQAVASRAKAAARNKKPDWMRFEILKLKDDLSALGYKKLAHTFNLKHTGEVDDFGRAVYVSASFVGNVIRRRRHELALARAQARKPHAEPLLGVWGIDMTGLPLTSGESISAFGILDHGSRICLAATPVARYNSLILLGRLIQTMGEWGLPRAIRSDNDAVFKTKLFRWTLKLIGVQQQWTDIGSPWQNGRIERFWRTLKEGVLEKRESIKDGLIAIKTQFKFADVDAMAHTLCQFQHLYNTQRPHQSLKGATPAMVWMAGKEKAMQKQATRAPPWLRW
jgi:putative transposase